METQTDIPRLNAAEFDLFQALIYKECGIHLKPIKMEMLSARLARRIRALGLHSFSEYYQFVTSKGGSQSELREMVNAVTTNKTSFFREPHHFDYLSTWLKKRAAARQRRFRFWSAATSTGEEPFTIAMTFLDALGPAATSTDARILATDIDTEVLQTARQGIYPAASIESLSSDLLRRHFLKGKGANAGIVKIKPDLQSLVSFRQLNLIHPSWPMRGPFDAIFCRNVLIYFDEAAQRSVVTRLVQLLVPEGHLFIGHSETLHWAHAIVKSLGHTIYQRRNPQ